MVVVSVGVAAVVATSVTEEVEITILVAEVILIREATRTPLVGDIKPIRTEEASTVFPRKVSIVPVVTTTSTTITEGAVKVVSGVTEEVLTTTKAVTATTGEVTATTVGVSTRIVEVSTRIEEVTTTTVVVVIMMTGVTIKEAAEVVVTTATGVAAEVVIVRKIFNNNRNGLKLMILFKLQRPPTLISMSRRGSTINNILLEVIVGIREVEEVGQTIKEEVEVDTVSMLSV